MCHYLTLLKACCSCVSGNCIIDGQNKNKDSCMACRYKKAAEIFPDPWTMPEILQAAGVKVSTCYNTCRLWPVCLNVDMSSCQNLARVVISLLFSCLLGSRLPPFRRACITRQYKACNMLVSRIPNAVLQECNILP